MSGARPGLVAVWALALAIFLTPTATGTAPAPTISGTTYYVRAAGSDFNSGTSPTSAWRTVDRVNRAHLDPGDAVLFRGGETFSDARLAPPGSGTASAPIVYGSFGIDNANLADGVFLSSVSHLTFDNLSIGGTNQGILGSSGGLGADDITIQNSTITNVGVAINSANSANNGWTITDNTINRTDDSGLILLGNNMTVTNNRIIHTGTDPTTPYEASGISLRASNATVRGNTIRDFAWQGVSARYRNSVVSNNTISEGPIGIGWRQNDSTAGTSYFEQNDISKTTIASIWVSASDSAGLTRESFVITNNTLSKVSGFYLDLAPTTGTYDRCCNNRIDAPSGATYYVRMDGSDSDSGTSLETAWRTVDRVNRADLDPGDAVLFESGETFSDANLVPSDSGTTSEPILYGSFGIGEAKLPRGVVLSSVSHVILDNLSISGTSQGILGSSGGSGADDITIQNSTITDVSIAIYSGNTANDGWTITGNTVDQTGDSALILLGNQITVTNNQITHAGTNSGIPYGKHGIYLKASNATVTGNTIRDFSANGVSARYHNSVVSNNTISDGPIGIAWFQNDSTAGTSYWEYNDISNTTAASIYVSPADSAGLTRESFFIRHNTLDKLRGVYLNLEFTTGTFTVCCNIEQ